MGDAVMYAMSIYIYINDVDDLSRCRWRWIIFRVLKRCLRARSKARVLPPKTMGLNTKMGITRTKRGL